MTDKTNVEEQGKNKIFDDAFATMVEEYPEILIPAINEDFIPHIARTRRYPFTGMNIMKRMEKS